MTTRQFKGKNVTVPPPPKPGPLSGLPAAIRKERRWYLVALRAAEAELRTISPEPVALEQVRARITAIEDCLEGGE